MKFWSNSETPPSGSLLPEKRLLAAVLQRAVTDYLTGDAEMREEAEAWLLGNDEDECPLTFSFICEALDLDADGLRRAIFSQAGQVAHGNNAASGNFSAQGGGAHYAIAAAV